MKNNFKKMARVLYLVMMFGTLLCASLTVQAKTKSLTGGSSMRKAKTMSSYNVDYVGKATRDADQTFYYKFKTKKADGFYNIEFKNLSSENSVHFYLLTPSEEQVTDARWTYKNNSQIRNLKLKANKWYYVKVETSKRGNFKINFKFTKDSEGDTMKKAKKVTTNKYIVASIDGKDDVDWFKFVPTKTRYYSLQCKNLSSDSGIHAYLVSKYEEDLSSLRWIYRNYENTASAIKLYKGKTYYVRVEGGDNTGKYKFRVKFN